MQRRTFFRQLGLRVLLFGLAFTIPTVSESRIFSGDCYRCAQTGYNFSFYCSAVGDHQNGDGIECQEWTTSGRTNCRVAPEPCFNIVVEGGGGAGGGGSTACTIPVGGFCSAECFVCATRI